MGTRLTIAALIYMLAQAVLFGVGALIVPLTPLSLHAMQSLPVMVVVTFLTAVPLSYALAPALKARYERLA